MNSVNIHGGAAGLAADVVYIEIRTTGKHTSRYGYGSKVCLEDIEVISFMIWPNTRSAKGPLFLNRQRRSNFLRMLSM